jgi:adenosylcobinamide-GDP ribazoletransferase
MIKGLILSLQFLSRIPINIPVDFDEKNLRKSTFFFPLVGVILGGLSGLVYYLFSFINIELASLLTVITMIYLTGGLHLDGIADMFDGFMANKDKETTLEIMKDSRIGTFGAVALILTIFTKYIVISNLNLNIPLILILSMANSRIVVGHKMIYKKIARPGGLGDMFHRSNPKKYALSGAIIYMAIILFLKPLYLMPLFTTIVAGEIISSITYKKIDGFTGDIYGATIEIGEIISLITFMGVSIWI